MCETCVADLVKPPIQIQPVVSTNDENQKGKATGETSTVFGPASGRSWQSPGWNREALNRAEKTAALCKSVLKRLILRPCLLLLSRQRN